MNDKSRTADKSHTANSFGGGLTEEFELYPDTTNML